MKNVKEITIIITEVGLKRFKTIPTYSNLFPKNVTDTLIVGSNKVTVNHYIYSKLIQLESTEAYRVINI